MNFKFTNNRTRTSWVESFSSAEAAHRHAAQIGDRDGEYSCEEYTIIIGTPVRTLISGYRGTVQAIQACNQTGEMYYDIGWETGRISRAMREVEFAVVLPEPRRQPLATDRYYPPGSGSSWSAASELFQYSPFAIYADGGRVLFDPDTLHRANDGQVSIRAKLRSGQEIVWFLTADDVAAYEAAVQRNEAASEAHVGDGQSWLHAD